jgi:hypothetical protein
MSGSGGGGGGGGNEGPNVDCTSFTKVTTINSAIPKVVKTLRVTDQLLVLLNQARGRIEVQTRNGDLAGSITFAGVSKLQKCLEARYQYVAIVKSVDGGDITVEIRSGTH